MLVLALDTSADITVCLVDHDDAQGPGRPRRTTVLAHRRVTEQRRHAELLAPMITEVLAESGLDRLELAGVVVGTGPAPFTGLRAGLVTARTLGFALGVPVHGLCSLDALAAQAFDAGISPDADVLVVTDARRRELYRARYRRRPGAGPAEVEPIGGPAVVLPADLAREPSTAGSVVVGPGAGLYPEHLQAAAGAPTALDAAVLARLALLRVTRGETLPTEPLYLRRPDVMPAAGRKRATG